MAALVGGALWANDFTAGYPSAEAIKRPARGGNFAGAVGAPSYVVRPVFRHSVIPGGVVSPEEMAQAISADHVVAAHYRGLNPATLRVTVVQDPFEAYVSYRVGDQVYWTRKKLLIARGERVLTDGVTMVRARCGNNISMDPLTPVADGEPTPDDFDSLGDLITQAALPPVSEPPTFDAPPVTVPPGLALVPPSTGGPAPYIPRIWVAGPPSVYVPGSDPQGDPPSGDPPGDPPRGDPSGDPPGDPPGNPPGDPPPGDPPVPVPEPGTLLLVGAGAAAGLARWARRGRRTEPPGAEQV